jgi:hypothetical protein
VRPKLIRSNCITRTKRLDLKQTATLPSELVMLDWVIHRAADNIWVYCPETLVAETTAAAVRQFVQLADSCEAPYGVVIDIRALRQYDSESRELWQKALRNRRDRVSTIVFISANPIFRMVGASVGLYTGASTQCVPDEKAANRAIAQYQPRTRVAS